MNIIGPLTTTFTPDPSCASRTGYTISSGDGGVFAVRGPEPTDTACFPPGFRATEEAWYSPALCPSGFTEAVCGVLDNGQVATVKCTCCPLVASVTFNGRSYFGENLTLPTQFACAQITSAATIAPLTRVVDGSTVTTDTTVSTSATIAAYGILIKFTSDDEDNVLEKPQDPERFNKIRLTYGENVIKPHHEALSSDGKIGIGVGVCFAAGLIAFGVLMFLSKRYYAHQQKSLAASETAHIYEAVEASPQKIRRKPVASAVAASTSSVDNTEAGRGYQPVRTIEGSTDGGQSLAKSGRRGISGDLFLWKWEILSIFISVLSLLAMIVVLHVYESHPLEDWKAPISINAVISILSAIFKGSLGPPISEGISQLKWLFFTRQPQSLADLDLFDKASRGAWGSVLLIFEQFRAPNKAYLTSFGAALAIVALITDPFAQATISLYSCQRNGSDIASIPRANSYTVNFEPILRYTPSAQVNKRMQLASYIGALNPPANSSASVPVLCATGNCTFPADGNTTFNTLTMCSQTWSANDEITAQDNETTGWIWSLGFGNDVGTFGHINASFIILPDTSRSSTDGGPWNTTSLIDVFILSMVRTNATNCNPPECNTNTELLSANFIPTGFTFSLFPCVQTVSASYTAGRYSETVISEEYLHYFPEKKAFQLAVDRTIINGTWRDCVTTESRTDSNTIMAFSPEDQARRIQDRSDSPSKWYAPECVFGMKQPEELSEFLGTTFFKENHIGRSTWANNLWNNGTTSLESITSFADGLSLSIGAEIRISAVGPNMLQETRGTTLVTKTCIRVHWGFLSFFATLFVLEVIFLLAVVFLTHRGQLKTDWKSSTLAVAFLSGGSARRKEWPVDRPESERSLRLAAEDVKVSLAKQGGNWKLSTEET